MLEGKALEGKNTEKVTCKNCLLNDEDINIIINEQIKDIGIISYYKIFEGIMKCCYDFNDDIIQKSGIKKEKLIKLKNSILFEVSKVTDNELPFHNNMDVLKGLRREIVSNIKSLNSYMIEILYYNEILNHLIIRANIENELLQYDEINIDIFIKELYRFVVADPKSMYFKVKSLTRVIPLRIAKVKYYDMLKKSLIKELKGNSCETIDFVMNKYKQMFNGTMSSEYGFKYDKYFQETQKYKNVDFKNFNLEQLKENEIVTAKVFIEMNKLAGIVLNWGILVNSLICINMLNEDEKKLIVDDNSLLHSKVQEYLKTKDTKTGNDIKDICNMNVDKLEGKINFRGKKLEEIYNTDKNNKNNIDVNLFKVEEMLLYINDLNFESDELIVMQSESADFNYLDQSIDNFIQFIDRNIKNMDILQRKVRMRRLLSVLTEVFDNIDDFMIYVSNILKFTSSKEELLMIVNDISYVMDNFK